MKALFLAPAAALVWMHSGSFTMHPSTAIDTTIITHNLDGVISEWPASAFETDKDAGVSYAVDNDATNLYVVMNIPNVRTQIKLMRQGMSLFLDTKGKKKKGKGIEFPVKRDDGSPVQNFQRGGDAGQRTFDPTAYRAQFALQLIKLKLFGFAEGDPFAQGLREKGSANIAFAWDSASGMHIEYSIPLSLLDDKPASLDKKEISVGWKINGVDNPSSNSNFTVPTGPSGRVTATGSRLGSGRSGAGGGSDQAEMAKAMEEEFIWTK